MNTQKLEVLVAEFFGIRANLIIPNVSWGFDLLYEADLVVVTRSRYAYEIELKVSKSDLKAEKNKRAFAHNADCFKRLYFAMPEDIYEPELVPEHAGVLLARHIPARTDCLHPYPEQWRIIQERKPENKNAEKLTDERYVKLLELCAMRMWAIKKREEKRQ